MITEIFPKNIGPTKILPVKLNLEGYYFYGNKLNDSSRLVIIYIKNNITSYPCTEVEAINRMRIRIVYW